MQQIERIPLVRLVARTCVLWLINVLGLWLSSLLLPGVAVTQWTSAFVFMAIIALFNVLLWPVVTRLMLRFVVFSLGFFTFLLNGLFFYLASFFVTGVVFSNLLVAIVSAVLVGVFVDPLLKKFAGFDGFPVGATMQGVVALSAYFLAGKDLHKANHFDLFPAKEVGLLFLGIFATMAPALGYLAENGAKLGINTPTAFYFATGSLSAVLDNAPTYLNFFQAAFGAGEMNAATIHAWLLDPVHSGDLHAISTGAVFFGAMTYIGNGPNFMVRSIAQSWSIKMPSFFGYMIWSALVLIPTFVLATFLFFRP